MHPLFLGCTLKKTALSSRTKVTYKPLENRNIQTKKLNISLSKSVADMAMSPLQFFLSTLKCRLVCGYRALIKKNFHLVQRRFDEKSFVIIICNIMCQ